jgi:hypothetical protein
MTTIQPYSLSLFWNGGVIVAAQRETKTVITDEAGNVLSQTPNPAEPIPHDIGVEILGEVNAGLLARIAELDAAIVILSTPPAPDDSPRAQARAAMRAQWDSLPAWIRGPFQHQFAAANVLLDAGQDDAAEALIEYAEVPTGYSIEQTESFALIRTELLAAIAAL